MTPIPNQKCKEANESLIYSIVGILCCGIILGPVAIWKGVRAKKLIAENPYLTGAGMATAGIVIGIIDTVYFTISIIYAVVNAMNNIPH